MTGSEVWTNKNVHGFAMSRLNNTGSFSLSQLNLLMNDPEWTRAVVLRDPVERFASAFLDKCWRNSSSASYICPDYANRKSVHAVLSALELRLQTFPGKIDNHFLPQAFMCDIRFVHGAYSVVPFESLAEGLASVALQKLGRDTLASWAVEIVRGSANNKTRDQASILGVTHRTNSSALVASWYEAAEAGPPHADADILPRLFSIYESDYWLLSEVRTWAVPPSLKVFRDQRQKH